MTSSTQTRARIADPTFEKIVLAPNESFRWYLHDYPHHLAKWHYHPEYELHLIQRTGGRMMIGDYIGPFEPGCLVLTGPNLPHNWVSDVPADAFVPDRDMLIQFSAGFTEALSDDVVEVAELRPLLTEASYGLLFTGATKARATALLKAVERASGLRRFILFLRILDVLSRRPADRQTLSFSAPALGVHTADSRRLTKAMSYIHANFLTPLSLREIADLCHMEPSSFSRFFKKQSGHNFTRYVNHLRISHACSLLAEGRLSITEVCFESGFNNTANFNRQFTAICRETPSRYREKAQTIVGAHHANPVPVLDASEAAENP